jgi:hypothetical protein
LQRSFILSIEPSGTLGLFKAGKVCEKAIRSGGFSGAITADKALQVLGFPDPDAIENSLIPNLVTFVDEAGAELDPDKLTLQKTTSFGDMQGQVAKAPLKEGK